MFDNLLKDDESKSGVDVLLELLNQERQDRIGNYEMAQIKIMVINKWHYLLKKFPDKPAVEIMNLTLEYFKVLKESHKGWKTERIAKAVTEMKEVLLEQGLVKDENKRL